jgi:hypothetical protein
LAFRSLTSSSLVVAEAVALSSVALSWQKATLEAVAVVALLLVLLELLLDPQAARMVTEAMASAIVLRVVCIVSDRSPIAGRPSPRAHCSDTARKAQRFYA